METRTRVVLLMHPKEFKEEKANTGRLTHVCLKNSEIICGVEFDENARVRELLEDEGNYCMLVYPGEGALNLSEGELRTEDLEGRRLVVFLLDGTWACARKMLRVSRCLQELPRVMFVPTAPSRYRIKQQPQEGCLSTLESVHELLGALDRCGLERYERRELLLGVFERMQDFQIRCAADPSLPSYRFKKPYGEPEERKKTKGRSGRRRMYLKS